MTNYARGANFEREIAAFLRKLGWFVGRSAGSHGEVDVFAHHGDRTLFIQAKRNGEISVAERKTLAALAHEHRATPVLADKKTRGVVAFKLVTPEGGLIDLTPSALVP